MKNIIATLLCSIAMLAGATGAGAIVATPGETRPAMVFDLAFIQHFIAYQKDDGAGNVTVHGCFYDRNGAQASLVIGVSPATGNHVTPAVALDDYHGRILVVWAENAGGSTTIKGQFYDSSRMPSAANFVISDATSLKYDPAVIYDSVSSRYLVTWQDARTDGGDIYGQLLQYDGQPLRPGALPVIDLAMRSTNTPIVTGAGTQKQPAVAIDMNASHKYLVAYADDNAGTWDVKVQFVDPTGLLDGTPLAVANDGASDQTRPSIVYDYKSTLKQYLVAYADSGANAVKAVLLSGTGAVVTGPFAVSSSASPAQPTVGYDSRDLTYLVTWSDFRSGSVYTVYAQKIDKNGALVGTDTAVVAAATNATILDRAPAGINTYCENVGYTYVDTAAGQPVVKFSLVGTPCLTSSENHCFIATAAYGSALDSHVETLRTFRDRWLMTNAPGRAFVAAYYRLSPPVASFIARHETARTAARIALAPVVATIEHPFGSLAFAGLGIAVIAIRKRRRRS